jgi:hypothetical protein
MNKTLSICMAAALAAALAVALFLGCGLKTKLVPRAGIEPEDERVPRNWIQPTPGPVENLPSLGEMSPQPAGRPGRLREHEVTPETFPPARPIAPPDASPAPEATP